MNQSVPGQIFTKVGLSLKCDSLKRVLHSGTAEVKSKIFTKPGLAKTGLGAGSKNAFIAPCKCFNVENRATDTSL